MHKDYNSRQRKIYSDYNEYSSENLYEIVTNNNDYLPEVIDVIYDILVERKMMLPREEKENVEEDDNTNSRFDHAVLQ